MSTTPETAVRTIDGIVVVADLPAPSPLPHPKDGGVLYFKNIRALHLADGRTLYGCADCDYTAVTPHAVRAHRSHHSRRRVIPRHRADEGPDDGRAALDQLMERVLKFAEVESDRDRWRNRAQRAEQTLAKLRRSLTQVVQ